MFGAQTRWLALACLVVSVLLTACGATPATSGGDQKRMAIAGSTSLQPLVDQAAKNFQTANKEVQITVSAGGSGSGRTGACQGNLDIGVSDVPLKEEEKTSLECADAVQTAVAMQAFAVVANLEGPGSVKALTKEQMQGIFGGTIVNWSEVGGIDQEIVLINRTKGSGTRSQMANYLYDGDDTKFAVAASEEDSNGMVVTTVGQAPGTISYVGVAFMVDPNLVAMGIQEGGAVLSPTAETVASGDWPIGGPGLAITKGEPSELEAAFLTYMLSSEFQSDPIWGNLGFIPPANGAIGNPTGS